MPPPVRPSQIAADSFCADEWNDDNYYDRQSTSFEQAYCGRGGFIDDIEFDPLKFGVMPNSVNGADTSASD